MEQVFTSKYIQVILLSVSTITLVQCQRPSGYMDGSDCLRNCVVNQTKNCFYHFRLETSCTMSLFCADCPNKLSDCFLPYCMVGGGYQRAVSVVNEQLPGPSIAVCQGDKVMVQVDNQLETGAPVTIHWHGQHVLTTPYMDGVPFVTQYPIFSGNTFTYEFWANTSGTHFWHSHLASQRGEGIFGPLIVRQPPSQNVHYKLYNFDKPEHTMTITDWNKEARDSVFQKFIRAGQPLVPDGILINGFGNLTGNSPLAKFVVTKGATYRFRIINANIFNCPWEISIDNHKLYAISTDGDDFKPEKVDSIITHAGERFDFLLKANKPVSKYWIKFKGFLNCEYTQIFQLAVLEYNGTTKTMPDGPIPTYETANNFNALVLNPLSRTGPHKRFITLDKLRSLKPFAEGIDTPNPRRFFLSVNLNPINLTEYYGYKDVTSNMELAVPQINNLTFKAPHYTLMDNRYKINESTQYCDAESMKGRNCVPNYCTCTHVLEVNLGEVVELIFVDEAKDNEPFYVHPMHIHGHYWYLLTWQELAANITREELMNSYSNYTRNFNNPPRKDTVSVPRGGVTIVRFLADNPGFWFMHCHIDLHSTLGMDLVIKIGSNSQIPNPPPHFLTCQNLN